LPMRRDDGDGGVALRLLHPTGLSGCGVFGVADFSMAEWLLAAVMRSLGSLPMRRDDGDGGVALRLLHPTDAG